VITASERTGGEFIEIDTIYNIDCLEGMKKINDSFFELSITSPPYNIKKDYGKYKDDMQWKDFIQWNEKVLSELVSELVRVSKKNVYIIGTHNNMEFFYKLREVLEKNNWFYQVIFCPRYLYTNPVELAIFVSKNDIERSGLHRPPVLMNGCFISWLPVKFGKVENLYKHHPASFPERIVNYFIKSLTNEGDIVLGPFMGSGTTAVSAKGTTRHFVGFEINPEYVDMANKRIKEHTTLNRWI
jgi:site-specific DNA-methyltransferase (adenine-specific)